MTHEDEAGGRQSGLSRARMAAAALDLVQEEGLAALSMRPLADRLGVKAASLYWHVRDRKELLELVAAALLGEIHVTGTRAGWRGDALAVCAALERLTASRRDSARVLLEVPEALEKSDIHARLTQILAVAGLPRPEAFETATMMLSAVLIASLRPVEPQPSESGRPVLLAIDSGSRGVTVRAGSGMSGLIRALQDPQVPAPAVIRGDRVTVRRLRGGRQAELELNPAHAWRFQVQAPTWNTTLDLSGLDVRSIKVDSGAARVECILPPPRGVVPIEISSGVAGIRLRRAPGVPLVADVSPGSLHLRLDGRPVAASTGDTRWESMDGASSGSHYRLKVSSGTMRVNVEQDASIGQPSIGPAAPVARAGVSAALNVALDGVAARLPAPSQREA